MSRMVAKFKDDEEAAFVRRMQSLTGLTERAFARIALINEAISIAKRIEVEVSKRTNEGKVDASNGQEVGPGQTTDASPGPAGS